MTETEGGPNGQMAQKMHRGATANASGRAAEALVCRKYEEAGAELLAERWRGTAGEIDLIFLKDDVIIFVEVKKSRSHSSAAATLGPRQIARIMAAGEEFVGKLPNGTLTQMQFDVALVNEQGAISVIEGALAA